MSQRRLDAGALELGGGLEVLLSSTLRTMAAGDVVDVACDSRATALELPGWARLAGHEIVSESREPPGRHPRFVVGVRRGASSPVLAEVTAATIAPPPLRAGGELHTADLRGEAPPSTAERSRGFTPLRATPERGGPEFDWRLSDRDEIWAEEVSELAEQASRAQWDASRDVPWEAAAGLPDFLEDAVAQVMTFIAQNEYVALYVPAAFLPNVNPAYPEVLLWLASHVHDEARHVEVFTKRSVIGGRPAVALASTELSLQTLLDERRFSAAALLLNVLGEGTFLDLLRFVEAFAPDDATRTAARMAHRDERRHVHFGVAHVRWVLQHNPERRDELVHAVEERAFKLKDMSGLHPLVLESLTIMAAGSMRRAELAEGAASVRALTARMARNRVRRLRAVGLDAPTARYISELHTPNLM